MCLTFKANKTLLKVNEIYMSWKKGSKTSVCRECTYFCINSSLECCRKQNIAIKNLNQINKKYMQIIIEN